jgi:hypothetical protein
VWSLKNPAYVGNAYGHCTRLVPAKRRRSPLAPVGAGLTAKRRPKEEWVPVSVPEIVKRETFDLVQHPPAPGGAPRGPFGLAMGPRWRTRAGLYGRAEGDWSGGGAARLAQSERG